MHLFALDPLFRRVACFGLGAGLWLLSVGAFGADREKSFDLFAFRKAAEVPQVWKAFNGSPAATYEPAAPAGVRFPCLFGPNTDRVYWDRAVSLDLRGYDLIELDFTCAQPDAIRTFGLYLKSGDGWYLWLTPLKEYGRRKLFFPITDAAVEGKPSGWDSISAVRISCTQGLPTVAPEAKAGATSTGPEKSTAVIAHGFRARACNLVIVQGTLSLADAGERSYARSITQRVSRWLQDFGLVHSVVDDEAVIAGRLKSAQLAILPYNSMPPDKELRALESFVKRGGKLMVFYSAEPRLAELMGFKLGSYQAAKIAGQWSSFVFNRNAPPYMPEVVYQDSSNIFPAYPANDDAKIIATWQNGAGKDLADPAWVMSPRGLWMSHVLLESDTAGKQRMLLAMLGAYDPRLWEAAAARAMARAGKVGPFISLADAAAGITRMARDTATGESVEPLLARSGQDYQTMCGALAKRQYPEVVEIGRRLNANLVEAYARAQVPKNIEFRGIWDHSGLGLYPGNWAKTGRILAESGLRAVFVNVLWAGLAHYDSQVVPQSEAVSRYGDQLKQCLAAARANRLETHVWKICWNLSNAPESFVVAMRKAGRLQANAAGDELEWLCPSNPDNVALELKAISEVVTRYAVDGIHLDYVRYPDNNACFCAGCRRRFGQRLGEEIRDWPRSAQSGALHNRYNSWRCEQITGFVRAAHAITRKAGSPASRRVVLSAAVYPEYPGCANSIGQDWGRWLKEDLVDFVCPMDYAANNGVFKNMVRRQTALAGARVIPGIGVTSTESQLTPDQVIEQIRQTREGGAGGFVLFDLNRTMERDVLPVLRLGITRTDR